MTAVLEQVKTAAYASVGVNLLVTDAIVGHEVKAPKAVAEHAQIARDKATEALTDLRGRTEPLAAKFVSNLPEQVADVVTNRRTAAWDFIGIEAPAVETADEVEDSVAKPAKKAAKKA